MLYKSNGFIFTGGDILALPDEFLYQLQLANPIETVVGSYVNLKRRGNTFVCLCPFHSEKSASCTIYPDTQSFFCFGCGAGGDTITFIKRIENLEYIEAVKLLAERAGLTVPDNKQDDSIARLKTKILAINRETANFYFKNLTGSPDKTGLKYLADRGLFPQTIRKYGLGYTGNDWDTLRRHMHTLGYSDEELVSAGVCKRNERGDKVFDAFRNRVMFPIIDLRGNIIAFGGRLISGDGPKYLNSSDTYVFKKSRNLFSLNFAKNSPVKRLILAEGYMDVIAINQAGFENVVATLGTALTPEQSRLMSQYAEEVIIAYDSDAPGQTATQKAINLLSTVGVNTRIIHMDGAKDPDEYIKKFGADRFRLLLNKADGAINFELEKCRAGLDLATEIGKVDLLKRSVNVLSQIANPLERDVYISKTAKECEINIEVLRAQVNEKIKMQSGSEKKMTWKALTAQPSFRDELNPEAPAHKRECTAEQFIIAYLIKNPDMAEDISVRLPSDFFVTSLNKKIYISLCEKIKSSDYFNISLLSSEFSVQEMGRITGIAAQNRDKTISEAVIDDCIKTLYEYKNKPVPEDSDEYLLKLQESLKNKK